MNLSDIPWPSPFALAFDLKRAQAVGGPSPNKSREQIAKGVLKARKIEDRWYMDGDFLREYQLGPERAKAYGTLAELVRHVRCEFEREGLALRLPKPEPATTTAAPTPQKRPRGRPRKLPAIG